MKINTDSEETFLQRMHCWMLLTPLLYEISFVDFRKAFDTRVTQGLREGGSGGTSYPGPGLGGPGLKGPVRVQVSALSFVIAP